MPHSLRFTAILLAIASALPAQTVTHSTVAVGDNAHWAVVGGILSALSYGSAKLLDRLRR